MKSMHLIGIFMFLSLTVPATGMARESFDHEHGVWNLLVKNHVRWNYDRTASKVDYAGFKGNQDFLQRYLHTLSSVTHKEFDSLPETSSWRF